MVTRYGLDGLGIESRWGARYSAPVLSDPGTHPVSYAMGTGSFQGVKRPGRGANHPPLFSAEVKERVELYLYSHSGTSWPVLGRTLPLPLPLPIVKKAQRDCAVLLMQQVAECFRKQNVRREKLDRNGFKLVHAVRRKSAYKKSPPPFSCVNLMHNIVQVYVTWQFEVCP
jgi:hypothetical protein